MFQDLQKKTGLANHMANVHQSIVDNVLSPMAATARTLFAGKAVAEDGRSTQGNSELGINSPPIVSGLTFMCGVYDNEFTEKEEVTKHMIEKHDNAHVADNSDNDFDQLVQDEQLLSEAMDEHDLYNSLDILAHSVAEPEKAQELQDKLKRYQSIMTKKTDLQIKTSKEIKRLKHEVKMSSQVTTEQFKQLDGKERDINKLSKEG